MNDISTRTELAEQSALLTYDLRALKAKWDVTNSRPSQPTEQTPVSNNKQMAGRGGRKEKEGVGRGRKKKLEDGEED